MAVFLLGGMAVGPGAGVAGRVARRRSWRTERGWSPRTSCSATDMKVTAAGEIFTLVTRADNGDTRWTLNKQTSWGAGFESSRRSGQIFAGCVGALGYPAIAYLNG